MGKQSGWIVIVGGIIVVIVLIFIHSYSAKDVAEERLKPTALIRVGVQDNPISAMIVIAAVHHLFHKQHIDVQLVLYPSGKRGLEAMLKGQVSITAASDVPILIHTFNHPNLSIIGTIAIGDSLARMVVRKGRGITTPRQLMGHRIVTQEYSDIDYYTYLFLQYYHIPVKSVILIYMPIVKLVQALRSGYADAAVVRSPYTQQAQRILPGQLIFFHVPHIYKQHFNLVTTKNFIKNSPHKIHQFMLAMNDASKYMQANPKQAERDVIHFFGLARRTEIIALWNNYQFKLTFDGQLVPTLKRQAAWAIKYGKVTSTTVPDFEGLIDKAPLEWAQAHQ
ncbi:MAG: hypothetical protein COB66_00595 [Coxiella sp. (in: Bacteria)]|nr:MAG: hypothetical protein COB66_00595 [Coxiella sp. (in: g-proteobacteria)]